jgi:hypothetical protein
VELKLERLTWVVQNRRTSHLGASNGAEESIHECTMGLAETILKGWSIKKKKPNTTPCWWLADNAIFCPILGVLKKKSEIVSGRDDFEIVSPRDDFTIFFFFF